MLVEVAEVAEIVPSLPDFMNTRINHVRNIHVRSGEINIIGLKVFGKLICLNFINLFG